MDADDVPQIRYGLETAVAVVGTGGGSGNGGGVASSDGVGGIEANGGDVATVGRRSQVGLGVVGRVCLTCLGCRSRRL